MQFQFVFLFKMDLQVIFITTAGAFVPTYFFPECVFSFVGNCVLGIHNMCYHTFTNFIPHFYIYKISFFCILLEKTHPEKLKNQKQIDLCNLLLVLFPDKRSSILLEEEHS